MSTKKPIPVIMDTDIGTDIDDTWALGMMLKCPELDVRLITSATGNTTYRAKLIAKMMEAAQRTDIPIGVGIHECDEDDVLRSWIDGCSLEDYPGKIHHDGVAAIVETIMNSPEPMTLLCIGPVPNIARALEIEPRIAAKTNFVGMHGSINCSCDGVKGRVPEYNVVKDVPAAQRVFSAPWRDMTITPLDTCGMVRLEGEQYQSVMRSSDPIVREIIDSYKVWSQYKNTNAEITTSILFDTVAVYLTYASEHLHMQRMGIKITDDGFTVPDESGRKINVALSWKDMDAYKKMLVDRLLSPAVVEASVV